MDTVTRPRPGDSLPRRDTPAALRSARRQHQHTGDHPPEQHERDQDAPPARPLAHHADMKRSEVARCLPTGSRRVRSQREALRVGLSHPDLRTVKDGFRTRLEDFWRVHVNYASWGGHGKPPAKSEPREG